MSGFIVVGMIFINIFQQRHVHRIFAGHGTGGHEKTVALRQLVACRLIVGDADQVPEQRRPRVVDEREHLYRQAEVSAVLLQQHHIFFWAWLLATGGD